MIPRSEETAPPGICRALTRDGMSLPVVDITHPAFALHVSDEEQAARVAKFLKEGPPLAKAPRFLRRTLLRLFLRGSVLARELRKGQGSFLSGMGTYLFKLGPENLGAYARPIDRAIAAATPAWSMRLRTQDMAHLLAEALAPQLAAAPGRPLRLVNIAGGPAIDSLNALIVLRREHPPALPGRAIQIEVLDGDEDGPAFGARALEALSAEGAPLHGLQSAFLHTRYDWRDVSALRRVLAEIAAAGAVSAGSSEGGLFEYGSDQEILANLACLRDGTSADFVMAGSVTRDDEVTAAIRKTSSFATHPRGLEVFDALARRAGWRVARAIGRPMSDQVLLVKA